MGHCEEICGSVLKFPLQHPRTSAIVESVSLTD